METAKCRTFHTGRLFCPERGFSLNVSTDYMLTGRSYETLHIQKQLSAAQDILAGLMKDLK